MDLCSKVDGTNGVGLRAAKRTNCSTEMDVTFIELMDLSERDDQDLQVEIVQVYYFI